MILQNYKLVKKNYATYKQILPSIYSANFFKPAMSHDYNSLKTLK